MKTIFEEVSEMIAEKAVDFCTKVAVKKEMTGEDVSQFGMECVVEYAKKLKAIDDAEKEVTQ